ncbi:MAG: hypothetical protein HXY18_13045 [Bryobacteraceae bacterium]|nr:hypothetical protein [Bryobacteraceae bacterium]
MIGIIWGATAAHLLTVSLGLLILYPLRVRLSAMERWAAAAACGLPAVTGLAHLLSAAGLFRRGVLQLLVAVSTIAAVWLYRRSAFGRRAPGEGLSFLPVVFMWAWIAFVAAGPDLTPPGEDAALASAHRFVSRFEAAPWSIGAVWAVPYAIGRHSAAALFHSSLLLPAAAPLGRFGWLAMLLFISHPGLMALGSRAGSAAAFVLSLLVAAGAAALALLHKEWRLTAVAILSAVAAVLAWPGPLDVFPGFVFLKSPYWLVPFLAAFAGWLVTPVKPAAFALAAFAVLTGAPPVTEHLASVQPKAAELEGLVEARFLDVLPPAAVVLTDIPMPGAWTPRRLAPHPEWLDEARRVAAAQWGQRRIQFPSSRIVEVKPSGFIGEAILSSGGQEIPRRPNWRVWPPGAFDGLPFTGSEGPIRIDTGEELAAGELRIIGTEGEPWTPPSGLRRNVVLEWRRRGITHVLVRDPQLVEEFSFHAEYWGVDPLGERNTARLYALR